MKIENLGPLLAVNALTATRAIFGLTALAEFTSGHPGLAAGYFAAGILTDLVDGKFARDWEAQSEQGWWNDRISDGIFFASLAISLVLSQPSYERANDLDIITRGMTVGPLAWVGLFYMKEKILGL